MQQASHRFALALTLGACACGVRAGTPDFMDAAGAYDQGQYDRCVGILAKMAHDGIPFPRKGELLYAACLGGAGRVDDAVAYLDPQLPSGTIDLAQLRDRDTPGLAAIRRSPRWTGLLARAEQAERARLAKLDQPLRNELMARVQQDQAARQATIDHPQDRAAIARMSDIDHGNTAWLKRIVDARGWPGTSLVGEDGAGAAFLLAQHADADPDFQARMLPLLEAAVARHEASPADLAMLTDRVLRAQGKPQRYGTQFTTGDDGVTRMQPVEDAATLDDRRARAGLPPIVEYKRMLGQMYRQRVE